MKRILVIVLALVLVLGMIPAVSFAAGTKATLSPQKLEVDGKSIDCEKYNINNYNYFKLRDIAKLLSGTGSQFEVGWDEASQTISITTGKPYTEVGGELSQRGDYSKTAKVSAQTVMINGKVVSDLSVYNIGNNNFFKLRDLGTSLGFDVDYDSSSDTAEIFSSDYDISPRKMFNNILSEVWLERKAGMGDYKKLETEGAKYISVDNAAAKEFTKEDAARLKSNSAGKEILTKEEAKDDITLCFKALHGAYSPYFYFGVDNWKTAENNILAWINTQTEVKSSELKEVLRKETAFMVDGHSWLGMKYTDMFGIYCSFVAFDYEFEKDAAGFFTTISGDKYYASNLPEGITIERTLFESGKIAYAPVTHSYVNKLDDQTITVKTADGKTKDLKLKWTILNPFVRRESGPDFKYLEDNGVAYISIRSFQEAGYPAIFDEFMATGTKVKDSKLIIFDLRSNGGGNGYSMVNWTENLTGKKIVPAEFRYHRVSRIGGTNPPEFLIAQYDKLTAVQQAAEENNIPIIVLTDNHTVSAGEYAVNILRQFKNAIVIGSNTQGAQIGGNPINLTLPNSGIPIVIGTHLRYINNFENHDIIGDDPDVWCNPYTIKTSLINMLAYYGLPQSDYIFGEMEADNNINLKTTGNGSLIRKGSEFYMDKGGLLIVVYRDQPVTDYTFTNSNDSVIKLVKKSDGKLEITRVGDGESVITITSGDRTSTFTFKKRQ